MSYVTSYDQDKPKFGGITLAFAVHLALAAAYIMIPAAVIERIIPTDPITVVDVDPVDPPPPPPPADPIKQPKQDVILKPVVEYPTLPIDPIIDPVVDDGFVLAGNTSVPDDIIPVPLTPEPVLRDAERDARFAHLFQPPYPPQLARMDLDGFVKVSVLIGPNGRVKQVRLIETTHDLFWKSTRRQALRKWRFKPATKDGVAVESWMELRVKFEMRG